MKEKLLRDLVLLFEEKNWKKLSLYFQEKSEQECL